MAAKELAIKFGKALLCAALARLTIKGIENKMNGKTVLGKEGKPKKIRFVHGKECIVLGDQEGWVE